ncbi:sugar phosphate isomerase/epimerase [Candidatus Bathyarchaeota archaeon]|nr:MAG: sugar phosphate isomerase/epimerase [Candidatus Bathyarchaeota archaeon]
MERNLQTGRWKIGFHTWSFASLPLKSALKHIRNAGFTEVEINADKTHLDPRVFPRSELSSLKNLLNDLGLHPNSAHAPIDGVDLSAQNVDIKNRSIDLLVKTLEYCRAIDCPILVVHPNHSDSISLGREVMKKNSIENLRIVVKKAEDLGVKIAIENMINVGGERFGSRISDLKEIIMNIGSPYLGICFDSGHANLQAASSDISIRDEIIDAGEYLWTLHIHDNDGSRDQHLPPGDGNIDWGLVIRTLREANYKGVFMMEIQERGDPDYLAERCLRIATEIIQA